MLSGKRIVLAASVTESNEYRQSVWRQMLYATLPARFAGHIFDLETVRNELRADSQAKYVPNGLRVVESILLKEFDPDDIAVCYPDQFSRFIGSDTRVVGLHAHNPLGISFATEIYSRFYGSSEPLNASEFRRMITHPSLQAHKDHLKLIVGGPGSWQIEARGLQKDWRIDCIVKGEAELEILPLFRSALHGKELPPEVIGDNTTLEHTPSLQGRATLGVVEITRGCGRGCRFCGPASRKSRSFPLEHILEDVRANVREGATAITLATEDLFLYEHGPGFSVNADALERLVTSVAGIEGVEYVSLTHGSLAPIMENPSIIERLTPIAVGKNHRTHAASTHPERRFSSFFAGIETGSPRLLRQYMAGKCYPFKPEQWPDIVVRSMEILNRHNWFPTCTWIIGLPGETDADTRQSLDLLLALKDSKWIVFPTLFVALDDSRLAGQRNADLPRLTPLQWELFFTCWRMTLDFNAGRADRLKYMMGIPFYYYLYARKHFGSALKYPFRRLAHFPEFLLKRKLYLDLRQKKQPPSCAAIPVPSWEPGGMEEIS